MLLEAKASISGSHLPLPHPPRADISAVILPDSRLTVGWVGGGGGVWGEGGGGLSVCSVQKEEEDYGSDVDEVRLGD